MLSISICKAVPISRIAVWVGRATANSINHFKGQAVVICRNLTTGPFGYCKVSKFEGWIIPNHTKYVYMSYMYISQNGSMTAGTYWYIYIYILVMI